MKFFAIIQYTIKETISQKVILLLLVVLTILLAVFIFGVHISAKNGVVEEMSLLGGKPMTSSCELADRPASSMSVTPSFLSGLAEMLIALAFLGTLVLCTIATAHTIPESLVNGTIILFLSRPLSRTSVLLGRYLGVALAVGMIQLYLVLGFWLVFIGKAGSINPFVLLTFPFLFISFASMFAWICLIGIISKSTGMASIFALLHVFALSALLANPGRLLGIFQNSQAVQWLVRIAYYALPQLTDLQKSATNVLAVGSFETAPIAFSLLSAVLALVVSVLVFRRMDF